jgi:hypothetical protein
MDSIYEIRTPVCKVTFRGTDYVSTTGTEYDVRADGEVRLVAGTGRYKDLRGEVLLEAGTRRDWRSSGSTDGICEVHHEKMEVREVSVRCGAGVSAAYLLAEAEKFPHPPWVWLNYPRPKLSSETGWVCPICVKEAKQYPPQFENAHPAPVKAAGKSKRKGSAK